MRRPGGTGQCPRLCKAWNTMVEEPVRISPSKSAAGAQRGAFFRCFGIFPGRKQQKYSSGLPFCDKGYRRDSLFHTGMGELDRVLGGGAVAGSSFLSAEIRESGKSTILLQTSCHMAKSRDQSPLYFRRGVLCGRSSSELPGSEARLKHLSFSARPNLAVIADIVMRDKPQAVVIDSIQTMYSADVASAPGSVSGCARRQQFF